MEQRHGSESTMRATLITQPGRVETTSLPLPEPDAGMVRLRVCAVGLCGTDVQVWSGRLPVQLPVIPGHEFAGEVSAVGAGVQDLRPGERVIAEGGWSCGVCTRCLQGAPHLCPHRKLLGRTVAGAFAEYVTVAATAVHRLPAAVDWITAQSAVTVATALHATDRVGAVNGKRVAVIGPGIAGLTLLQILKLRGARSVAVFGTRRYRLDIAAAVGADETVNVRASGAPYLGEGNGDGFDIVVEASGAPAAFRQALALAGTGGSIAIYGITEERVDGVRVADIYRKELSIVGSKGAGGLYDQAIELLAEGALQVEPLISHQLSLDQLQKAFEMWQKRSDQVMRVVIIP